ncbi:MAG: nitrite/sulfite reductase [Candidatus Bathyarchaeia archaeon]
MSEILPAKIEAMRNRYVLGKDRCEGSECFLRIKIPNGRLTADQFTEIASLSQEYGRGYAEITDRQNIQLHWIDSQNALNIFSRLEKTGFSTDHGGQGIPTAHGGDVRAVVSCPAAGLIKDELVDPWPIVKQLDSFFNGNIDFLDLPRKFKISISSCMSSCGDHEMQDLSFVAIKQPSGIVGFVVYVGGTVAAAPQLAKPLNVVVQQKEILDVARCAAEVFRDFGSREVKAKARFRWLVEAWGVEKLRKTIEAKMAKTLQPYTTAHLENFKAEHVGVQPQKQKGYSFINIPVSSGILDNEKMVKIANISKKLGNGELRLTPYQNIILANVPDESIEKAAKALEEIGYQLGSPYLRWATIACAGNFCGKTIDHPKNRAKESIDCLEKRFGDNLKKIKLQISFSGCPNGCARHLIADIGLQGCALNIEGRNVPAYNIYLKGSVKEASALGKLIQRGVNAEQVKLVLANLVEAYLGSSPKIPFSEFYRAKAPEEIQKIINLNPAHS